MLGSEIHLESDSVRLERYAEILGRKELGSSITNPSHPGWIPKDQQLTCFPAFCLPIQAPPVWPSGGIFSKSSFTRSLLPTDLSRVPMAHEGKSRLPTLASMESWFHLLLLSLHQAPATRGPPWEMPLLLPLPIFYPSCLLCLGLPLHFLSTDVSLTLL